MDKATLRKEMIRRRAVAAKTTDVAPALAELERQLTGAASPVSFYWPIRTEIDPRPVMELVAATTPVCLPVTHGRDAALTFRRWTPGSAMDTDGFGVAVPRETEELIPATLVVPMLGFDTFCQRLGYGAGHYDRTLAGLKAHTIVRTIGFAYAAQALDEPLPAEPTDQPLDMIVTEIGVITPTQTL